MKRSRSSGKLLDSSGEQSLSDEQLYRLIMRAYDETQDVEQLQMTLKNVMRDDPERIRMAYMKVVELKGRSRSRAASEQRLDSPKPALTLALAGNNTPGNNSRASQRRKSTPAPKAGSKGVSVIVDATNLRESGGLERLKGDLAALCCVQHQNLLNLVAFNAVKGTSRFFLDFDLANIGYATLFEMFHEEATDPLSLNGCEVACILAQVCIGMLFLTECVTTFMRPLEVTPAECLRPENIVLTESGLVKICGHHEVMRLPARRPTTKAGTAFAATDLDETEPYYPPDKAEVKHLPGYPAHRLAMLLYELDHPRHLSLGSLRRCQGAERKLLDERYAKLFSQLAEWELDRPVDLRSVLHSEFICEQTSSIASFQMPLEFTFAARFS